MTEPQLDQARTSRRYRVEHRTEYTYSRNVTASYGLAHLVPRELPDQRRLVHSLTCKPASVEWHEHRDFFGNTAAYFAIFTPHRSLTVLSSSEVEINRPEVDLGTLDAIGWEVARSELEHDVAARAFTIASPLVPLATDVADYAESSFDRGRGLGTVMAELAARMHSDFEYVPGATTVRTTLGELLQKRRGVCQDFAHLAVGCFRSMGLPARYVSGYLETRPPAGRPKLVGSDASHAWAEVLVPGLGWVGIDPTNNKFVDAGYVITAWGRDYADVPPLSGVIVTDSRKSSMKVSVDVTRLGE